MKVLIAGDFMPRNRVEPLVKKKEWDSIFGNARKIIQSVDYSIINFESPIVNDGDTPIDKCGPNLSCSEMAVEAIVNAGFKCVTLANNHIRDYGDVAVRRTIKLMEKNNIEHVGAGKDLVEASAVLYVKLEGKRLAIINCCETEFSIASKYNSGACPLSPIQQYYSIKEARKQADYVMVIVHGGHEMYQLPSPRMQDTYRFFIDSGADIVVNHHQHCYSGYETYNNKTIVYGLGNFCMDKSPIRIDEIWNYGYMVIWDTYNPDKVQIVPYEQCGKKPGVHLLEKDAFHEDLRKLNHIISNRELLEKATAEYYTTCFPSIENAVEPFNNKYLAALRKRHLIPSFLLKKQRLRLQDYILCESHRDKMEFFFKSKNKN